MQNRERRGGKEAEEEEPHSPNGADREVRSVRCHKRRRNCMCRTLSLRLPFATSDSLQPSHGDNEIFALAKRKRWGEKKHTEELQAKWQIGSRALNITWINRKYIEGASRAALMRSDSSVLLCNGGGGREEGGVQNWLKFTARAVFTWK